MAVKLDVLPFASCSHDWNSNAVPNGDKGGAETVLQISSIMTNGLRKDTVAIPPFREDGWLPIGHHQATWEEVTTRFGGLPGGRRAFLTGKLLELRDALRSLGVTGWLLLDGSYISAKEEPGDFDVLLIGPSDIQAMKDADPRLAFLLDAENAEKIGGYSLFYIPSDSSALATLSTFWDLSKEGIAKGIVQVQL
jgi:hypothetical protein